MITPAENNSTTDGTMPAVRYPVALLTSALVLTVVAFAGFGWVISDPSHAAKIARDQSTRMALTIGALTILAISFAAWLSVLRGLRRWRIDLERVVGERRQAEEGLRRARDELEVCIAQRTAELGKTNQALQTENSERQQTEESLRVSEEQFRAMFELASVGIAQSDPRTGRWLFVNQKMCAITGYSAAEMLQMRVSEITHPDDREKDWGEFKRVVRGEAPNYRIEKRYTRKDGTLAWVNVNMTVIRDAAGQPTRTVAAIEDITARKELEAQMERLRTEYALVLDSIGEGVHWLDADGRIKFENPAAAKMLGYEASELIGQPAHATMHHTRADGTAYPVSECHIYATLRDGMVRRVTDEVFWRKDGTSFAVEYLCTPVRDKNGRSGGSVVIFTDITERKRAEETIRRERDFSQAALDSLPGLFYLFDDQGRFLRWNKNLERVSGYSAAELSRMIPLDLLGETDKGRSADAIQRVFQTGEATVEVDFLAKDQTKIPFHFAGKLFHFDQKSCVMGMGIDITERKRAEEALRASQQIIKGILNAIPVRVFWKDKNLVYLGCNAVFARDAGFGDPKDIIGKDDYQMEWHDQAEAYRKDDRQTIESGNSKFNIEESQTTPDGKTITVLTSKIPLRNSTGQISGVLGTYVDITERKLAEAALKKVNQELVVASRQAGMAEVATSVLHNVGNVLNSVGVSATLVANQVHHTKAVNIAKLAALLNQHQADLASFLTTDSRGQTIPAYLASLAESLATEQTMLLAEIALLRQNIEHIKDIVSLQQANAHTSGATETVSIPDLIEEALGINADALARYNVTTIRDYQARPVATTDKNRVLQILINLVRNAKLACVDSGRPDQQITVRITSDDRRAKIAVSDNGVGIPAENLTRIFNHGFTTRKTGHGFALHSGALAAQQLGGALTVQSDGPGRGATFTLELPCQLAPPRS